VSARKNRCGGQRTARLQIDGARLGSSIPVGLTCPTNGRTGARSGETAG
jgi:hypothetical protein